MGKPVVWAGATLRPAIAGICRVEAGQHHWTDVITGYAIGACIGTLVSFLHQKKFENKIPTKKAVTL